MIKQTIIVPHATAREVYDVLMDSKKHSDLTGDVAKIDAKVGGIFTAFSGYADGKTTGLVPGKRIEQTWRAADWPAGHYSKIVFELKDVASGAEIRFTQTDLPSGTESEFVSGWEDNYWKPLKKYFTKSSKF